MRKIKLLVREGRRALERVEGVAIEQRDETGRARNPSPIPVSGPAPKTRPLVIFGWGVTAIGFGQHDILLNKKISHTLTHSIFNIKMFFFCFFFKCFFLLAYNSPK